MRTHASRLAESGAILTEIILPESPNAVEIFAGEQLEKYLRMMSSSPAEKSKTSGAKTVILFERKNDPGLDLGPDVDGFEIAAEAGRIRLSGNRRGLLYAVYELLERLGARFCFPGEEGSSRSWTSWKYPCPPR